MSKKKKAIEPKCKNCLCYNREQGVCKVAILVNGEQIHLPVSPEDNCHMEELGIPVQQVRWWVEDPKTGKPTDGDGVVKMEYPCDFFGKDKTKGS
jgi:hypothetical protein